MLKVVNYINELIKKSDDPWGINSLKSEPRSFSRSSIKQIILSGHAISPRHFWYAVNLVNKKIISFMPALIKDILFFSLSTHKCPESKFFAKTRYELLRIKIDLFASKLFIYTVPKKLRPKFLEIFNRGIVSLDIGDLSNLDDVLLNCFDYSKPSHGGARAYSKANKNLKFNNSSSTYFQYSQKDSDLIIKLINERIDLYHLYISALSGYYCRARHPLFNIGITIGDNSNSEMHQDTWSGLVKGFLYVSDVSENISPFEYLEKSHLDSELRSNVTNSSVLSGLSKTNGSTRMIGENLNHCLSKFKLRTCIGKSGTIILANTAGYHREGPHSSEMPRILLTFGYKRRGILSKLLINLFAILLTKLRLI